MSIRGPKSAASASAFWLRWSQPIAQPLPLLKAQVGAVLNQAALRISREREASQPRKPFSC
ncbi:MAG: hypothetical protein ACK5QW_10035 [Cyanobacteriota bacterium]|jgi:hypothetical protein